MTKNLPEGVDESVNGVAGAVWRQYRRWVDREDLVQEGYIWCLSRIPQIQEAMAEPDESVRKHNERRLWWQLKRVCERYARREKATRSGYVVQDEFFYETSTIAQMLPHILTNIFDGVLLEQAQQLLDDGMPKRSSAPAEGRNLLAMLIDIKKGYEQLEQAQKDLIKARYYDNLTLAQMAQLFECSISTADRRCENAIKALQRIVGGENPWT